MTPRTEFSLSGSGSSFRAAEVERCSTRNYRGASLTPSLSRGNFHLGPFLELAARFPDFLALPRAGAEARARELLPDLAVTVRAAFFAVLGFDLAAVLLARSAGSRRWADFQSRSRS